MSRYGMSCYYMKWLSCYMTSCDILSCHQTYPAGVRASRDELASQVKRYLVHVLCHAISCYVMSFHAILCHVLSCPVMSCHFTRHIRLESELAEMNWRVKWDDILFGSPRKAAKLERQGSRMSLCKVNKLAVELHFWPWPLIFVHQPRN